MFTDSSPWLLGIHRPALRRRGAWSTRHVLRAQRVTWAWHNSQLTFAVFVHGAWHLIWTFGILFWNLVQQRIYQKNPKEWFYCGYFLCLTFAFQALVFRVLLALLGELLKALQLGPQHSQVRGDFSLLCKGAFGVKVGLTFGKFLEGFRNHLIHFRPGFARCFGPDLLNSTLFGPFRGPAFRSPL